jgi:hypothetical protein
MARFKICLRSRAQGKTTECMVIGDTLEQALAGCRVYVYEMKRTIVKENDQGDKFPRPIAFDKRVLVKMVEVGEPIEELPL